VQISGQPLAPPTLYSDKETPMPIGGLMSQRGYLEAVAKRIIQTMLSGYSV